MKRRTLLIGAGAAAGGAGCISFLRDDDDSEGASAESAEGAVENGDETGGDQTDTNTGAEPETSETETGAESNATGENGSGNESEPEPESSNETGNESEPVEDSTRPETVNVDDAIEADLKYDVKRDVGVAVFGTVENITSAPIDLVSVTVWLYDAENNILFKKTDGKTGLMGGDSWEFEIVTRDAEIANQFQTFDVEVVAEQLD